MAKKAIDIESEWVLVRALVRLGGGGGAVEAGEEYLQPPEAAQFMVEQGWVEIVEIPAVETSQEAISQ